MTARGSADRRRFGPETAAVRGLLRNRSGTGQELSCRNPSLFAFQDGTTQLVARVSRSATQTGRGGVDDSRLNIACRGSGPDRVAIRLSRATKLRLIHGGHRSLTRDCDRAVGNYSTIPHLWGAPASDASYPYQLRPLHLLAIRVETRRARVEPSGGRRIPRTVAHFAVFARRSAGARRTQIGSDSRLCGRESAGGLGRADVRLGASAARPRTPPAFVLEERRPRARMPHTASGKHSRGPAAANFRVPRPPGGGGKPGLEDHPPPSGRGTLTCPTFMYQQQ